MKNNDIYEALDTLNNIDADYDFIKEASISRVYKHLLDAPTLAIISTYVTYRNENENINLLKDLKSEIRKLGLGFNELLSRWVETDEETGQVIASDERSLLIPNISYEDAIRLGAKYDQSSIIFKDENGCKEICTTPFTSYDDKQYMVNDVVRTFNTSRDDKGILNLKDAEDIFAKRKGGPASKLTKGKKAFHLSEVLEYEKPRASYFQNKGTFRTIYKKEN